MGIFQRMGQQGIARAVVIQNQGPKTNAGTSGVVAEQTRTMPSRPRPLCTDRNPHVIERISLGSNVGMDLGQVEMPRTEDAKAINA